MDHTTDLAQDKWIFWIVTTAFGALILLVSTLGGAILKNLWSRVTALEQGRLDNMKMLSEMHAALPFIVQSIKEIKEDIKDLRKSQVENGTLSCPIMDAAIEEEHNGSVRNR